MYTFSLEIYVSISSLNNGYQMDKLVQLIILPLVGDVVLNHKLVS